MQKSRLLVNSSRCLVQAKQAAKYSSQVEAKALRINKFGQPKEALTLDTVALPSKLEGNQVLVKFLAAPINPADINVIEGNYATLPKNFPAFVGNEGVATVIATGPNSSLKVGARVIPAQPAFGTWRTHAVANDSELQEIDSKLAIDDAATIAVNPSTAFRLLADFVQLKEGDVIVQNGATSAVGLAVIQIARAKGIKTINIIRSGAGQNNNVERLKQLGGTIVVSDEYANTAAMRRLVSDLPKPKLALNCVGGNAARVAANLLGEKGVMVTYGGMSRQPITMPTGPFIFKDIALRGFWLSKWIQSNPAQARQAMLKELSDLILRKQLVGNYHSFLFTDYAAALEAATSTTALPDRRKVVMHMEQPGFNEWKSAKFGVKE